MLELGREMPVQSSGVLLVTPTAFRFNLTFFGFQIELDQLSKKLRGPKKRDFGLCAVLVHGGPGSGKSHLVRQYVWQNRERYSGGVFWVDARSEELLFQCFWDIAQAASLTSSESFGDNWDAVDNFAPAVKAWLEDRDDWLLVFDNLTINSEDQLEHFSAFIPYRKTGNIIYTSVNRTLARKSRLFHPADVKVRPLSPEDARLLLYDGLGISRPTSQQEKKATEVVKHLECLPLAIYALSHRLFATGKTIEKYQIGSYKTDSRLAEPYIEIMEALRKRQHKEAISLINILSMLGHYIPVALVLLGRKALADYSIEIRSAERDGIAKQDLDTTIATLIRYGLVERALQPYTNLEHSFSLGSKERLRLVEDRSESQNSNPGSSPPTGSLDASSSQESIGGIDILQVHAVVQGFCRDELWSREKDKYWWCLRAAVGLFCTSYRRAAAIIAREPGGGLVRDFREYECHAVKLHSHFPKKEEKASESLRRSRHELRNVIRLIKQEIQKRSPQQSFESIRHIAQASIFDRTSSTSSQGPETPNSAPSRTSTWTLDDFSKEESPTDYRPCGVGQYRLDYHDEFPHTMPDDLGNVSVVDMSTNPRRHESTGGDSENTAVANSPAQDVSSSPRFSLQRFFKGHLPGPKTSKDLGDWRPAPSKPTISYSEANFEPAHSASSHRALSSSSGESPRPTTATSEATNHLAAVYRSSSLSKRGGRIRSPSRSGVEKQQPPGAKFDRVMFENISHAKKLSPFAAEFKPRGLQQDNDDGSSVILSSYDNSRRASASSVPPQIGIIQPMPELPIEGNIAVTRPIVAPGLGLAITTNQPTVPLSYATGPAILPMGYSSQPMTRDGSKESSISMSTEPPRFKPSFSQSPGPRFAAMSANASPQMPAALLAPIPIDVSHVRHSDSLAASPVSPILAHSSSGSEAYVPVIYSRQPPSRVQFGESEPVDIPEARRRTEEYQRRLPFERGEFRPRTHQLRPYPNHNMIPTPSDEGMLSGMVESSQGKKLNAENRSSRGFRFGRVRKAFR
ncbi:MAG: hypothetical protein Q9160_001167 [Pyrenula sp. 1 TL-2023]